MTEEKAPDARALNRLEEVAVRDYQLRNSIDEDLKQFKRLRAAFPNLTDEDLAHRLVMSKKQLRNVRKLLGE